MAWRVAAVGSRPYGWSPYTSCRNMRCAIAPGSESSSWSADSARVRASSTSVAGKVECITTSASTFYRQREVLGQRGHRDTQEVVVGVRGDRAAGPLDLGRDLIGRPALRALGQDLGHDAVEPRLVRRHVAPARRQGKRDVTTGCLWCSTMIRFMPSGSVPLMKAGNRAGRRGVGAGGRVGILGLDRCGREERTQGEYEGFHQLAPPLLAGGFTIRTRRLAGSRYFRATRCRSAAVTARCLATSSFDGAERAVEPERALERLSHAHRGLAAPDGIGAVLVLRLGQLRGRDGVVPHLVHHRVQQGVHARRGDALVVDGEEDRHPRLAIRIVAAARIHRGPRLTHQRAVEPRGLARCRARS